MRDARLGGRSSDRLLARTLGVPLAIALLATASAGGWTTYRVKSGDTLTEIASHFDVTVAKLIEANNLPGNGDLIYIGSALKIPVAKAAVAKSSAKQSKKSGKSGTKAKSAPTTTKTVLVPHKVVLGDTLIGLAAKFDTTQAAITKANHLKSTMIMLNSTLQIPVKKKVKGDNTFAGRTYPDAVVKAAAHNRALLAERKVPDKAATKKLIVKTAKALDVDPSLALAVAWQESGWNQRRVSVANAIGIMQVIPSTGRWISEVVGEDLNLLDPKENVIAGVSLLKFLTGAASTRNAVAGYYQGLSSVQKNGMHADTKRYVDNVLALRKNYR